jgi:acetyl-CoA C-acetyltransferase
MARRVAIIGIGQTRHTLHRWDVSWPELMHESAVLTFEDAHLTPDDIDAVIFGSAIQIQEGIEHPGKWCADSIAGPFKPQMRFHTGGTVGASTISTAFYMISSGLYDVMMCSAGTQRSGASGRAAQRCLATAADPIFLRGFATGTPATAALIFMDYMRRSGAKEEHAAMCAAKQRRHALNNPYAHMRMNLTVEDVMNSEPIAPPIKRLDICPTSIGSAACILASEDIAKKICKSPAWIKGTACIAEPDQFLGRDIVGVDTLGKAATRAYKQAGITDPRKELDVVEIYDAFSFQEMLWSEGLHLFEKGTAWRAVEAGVTGMHGDLPINPSGGTLSTNNGSDAAMLRVLEAALQVTGKAGDRQVDGARTACAMSWGGRTQFFNVMVVSSEP